MFRDDQVTTTGDDLLAKLRKKIQVPEQPKEDEFDEELIPDVGADSNNPELDAFMEAIDILDAYRRWCGKMEPKVGSKRESIMVSCPKPGHEDKNPSAWVNLDKQTWFCGGCQEGGDKFDIAAYHFGYSVPDYKLPEYFPDLVTEMAEDMGFVVRATATGVKYLEAITIEEDEDSETSEIDDAAAHVSGDGKKKAKKKKGKPASEDGGQVLVFPTVDEDGAKLALNPLQIDWEKLFPSETFLRIYMEAVCIDDIPHEYHVGHAFQALGAAVGHHVWMADTKAVKANLNTCVLGTTGSGKSKSVAPFEELIREALPFHEGDEYTAPAGVMISPVPASAEALVDLFQHTIQDPSTNEVIGYSSVNGLLPIDELSEFYARATRQGSSMKEVIMQMFDGRYEISQKSLTGGLRRAHMPFCQVVTTTQPRAIQEFLNRNDEHTGFLNRWMILTGQPRMAPVAYGGFPPDVSAAVESLREVHAWAVSLDAHAMMLSGDPLDRWTEFFHDVIVPLKNEDLPIMGRMDLLLKKFMLVFAINEKRLHPSLANVDAAISLFGYMKASLSFFATHIKATDYDHCWHEIIRCINWSLEKKKKPPTRRELNNLIKEKFSPTLVTQVLVDMVRAEVVKEEVVKAQRGPTTTRYSVLAATA